MVGWTLVAGAGLVAAAWRNGLGTSYEIASGPGWTVSIAALERDAAFSDYPGMDRVFTPIDGVRPPELAFQGGPFTPCPLLVPRAFAGDIPTVSRIPAPGRAFNVIVARAVFGAEVAVLRLTAGDVVAFPDAAHVVVHCLQGRVAAAGACLGAGDSLVGSGPGVPGTALEDGVVLVAAVRAAAGRGRGQAAASPGMPAGSVHADPP